jgi:hypothetical protein
MRQACGTGRHRKASRALEKASLLGKKRHGEMRVPGFAALLPSRGCTRHNLGMGRKDKGREICINCGQTFHKKLTSKELRCTKCRKAEKKAA